MKTRMKMSTTKRNLLVDLLIVSGFLLAWQACLTGMAIHEWLGLGSNPSPASLALGV